MSDNKKYYYLKLKDDFFDSDAMIVLESMPDGYMYSNILLKLYLRSLKQEGKLMFSDRIPYNSTILAQVTRHSVGDVEKAIKVFRELELIETLDNGAIYMLDIQNFIGTSSTEADRIRAYRSRIKQEKEAIKIESNKDVTNVRTNVTNNRNKSTPEIEIEKEIDIELQQEQQEKRKLNDYVDNYKEVNTFYQNNFGVLNPYTAEDLKMWVDDLSDELVLEALKRASDNQKSYAYAKGIMKKWDNNNVKTLEDVKAQDVAFMNQRNKEYGNNPKPQIQYQNSKENIQFEEEKTPEEQERIEKEIAKIKAEQQRMREAEEHAKD